MTYHHALRAAQRGADRASGDAHLAHTCATIALMDAIVPEMLYEGAKRAGLDSRAVSRMDTLDRVRLMWSWQP